jgi:hypothetical protein
MTDFGANNKDQNGKEMGRVFAPNMRDPADKYKVRIVKVGDSFEIVMVGNRPTVRKVKNE